jgi:hypothetical protein
MNKQYSGQSVHGKTAGAGRRSSAHSLASCQKTNTMPPTVPVGMSLPAARIFLNCLAMAFDISSVISIIGCKSLAAAATRVSASALGD